MTNLMARVRTPRVLMLFLLLVLRNPTLCFADEDEESESDIRNMISTVLERIEDALARLMELITPSSASSDSTTSSTINSTFPSTEPPDGNSTIIDKDDTAGNATVTDPASTDLPNITIDTGNSTKNDSSDADSKEDDDSDNDWDSNETIVTTVKTVIDVTNNNTRIDAVEGKNTNTTSGSVTNSTGMINEGDKSTTETTTMTKNAGEGEAGGGTTKKNSGQIPNDHHAEDPEEFQNDNVEDGDDPSAQNPHSEIEKAVNSTADTEGNKPERLNNPSAKSPTLRSLPETDLKGVIEIEAEFLSNMNTNGYMDGSEDSSKMKNQSIRESDSVIETGVTRSPKYGSSTRQTAKATTKERKNDNKINISNSDTKVPITISDITVDNNKKNSSKESEDDSEDVVNEYDKTLNENESKDEIETVKIMVQESEKGNNDSEDEEEKDEDSESEDEVKDGEDASEIEELSKENPRSYKEDESDETELTENDSEEIGASENESKDTKEVDEDDSEGDSESEEYSEDQSKQNDDNKSGDEYHDNDSEDEDKSESTSSEEYDPEDESKEEKTSSEENKSESEEELNENTKKDKEEETDTEHNDKEHTDKPEEEEAKTKKTTKDKKRTKRSVDDQYKGVCKTGVFVDGKDLCKRLNDVLSQTDEVMRQINSGNISKWHLKALEMQSQTLDEIVTEIERDPKIFNSINRSLIASRIKDTELQVRITNDFVIGGDTISDVLILVIAIGTCGGFIVVSLFCLLCYCCFKLASIRREKKKLTWEEKIVIPVTSRKISSLDRYNGSFSNRDTMPVGGEHFSPPAGLAAFRPIPRPRSTQEAFDMNGRMPYDTYSLPRDGSPRSTGGRLRRYDP